MNHKFNNRPASSELNDVVFWENLNNGSVCRAMLTVIDLNKVGGKLDKPDKTSAKDLPVFSGCAADLLNRRSN